MAAVVEVCTMVFVTMVLVAVTGFGTEGDRRQALGDVLWALLNTAEFSLNH